MKPGTLVVCINDKIDTYFLQPIKEGDIYTIRKNFIRPFSRANQVYLEEIVNINAHDNIEAGYLASNFRELEDNLDINQLMEETEFVLVER